MESKIRTLWILFFITLLASVVNIAGELFNVDFLKTDHFNSLILYLPVIAVLLHAVWTLSPFRGLLFIATSCLTGFVFEFFGLKYGTVFGGSYEYLREEIKFLTVPINVIFYWGVFIYTGYCVTNSFLFWLSKSKPIRKNREWLFVTTTCSC